jgi:hypothetical protein
MESRLGLLLGAVTPDSQTVLSAFINLANDLSDHVVFVLDDYHLIAEPAIHEAMTSCLTICRRRCISSWPVAGSRRCRWPLAAGTALSPII